MIFHFINKCFADHNTTSFSQTQALRYCPKSIIHIAFDIHQFFSINGFMNFGTWSIGVGIIIDFGTWVGIGTRERDELPIRAYLLLGNDDFVGDDWLSGNWELTRSKKYRIRLVEAYFCVDFTFLLAHWLVPFLEVDTTLSLLEMHTDVKPPWFRVSFCKGLFWDVPEYQLSPLSHKTIFSFLSTHTSPFPVGVYLTQSNKLVVTDLHINNTWTRQPNWCSYHTNIICLVHVSSFGAFCFLNNKAQGNSRNITLQLRVQNVIFVSMLQDNTTPPKWCMYLS